MMTSLCHQNQSNQDAPGLWRGRPMASSMSAALRAPPPTRRSACFDHGLLYGDGVFEGIRAYNGRVFKLERHIDRLFDSAKAIRLDDPADARGGLRRSSSRPAAATRSSTATSACVVTRGPGDLGIDPRKCPRAELIVIARAVHDVPGGRRPASAWSPRRSGATRPTRPARRSSR